ncbi:MAG: hypothetical protein AAFP85_11060 [Pseudomonadota bacterium]
MVAKPQIEDGARNRAGMPLARAQRLSDKAASKERSTSSSTLLVVLAIVATIGGGVVFVNSSAQAPEAAVQDITIAALPQVTGDTNAVISDVQTASAETPPPTQAPVDITEEPAPSFAPRPTLSPCFERVEDHLTALYRADIQSLAWEVKRDRIRAAAQTALNCEGAGVSFAGDFELTATDFADLRVQWDRTAGHLAFTIVDSMAPEASDVVLTDDGQPIAFIVH